MREKADQKLLGIRGMMEKMGLNGRILDRERNWQGKITGQI